MLSKPPPKFSVGDLVDIKTPSVTLIGVTIIGRRWFDYIESRSVYSGNLHKHRNIWLYFDDSDGGDAMTPEKYVFPHNQPDEEDAAFTKFKKHLEDNPIPIRDPEVDYA